MGGKILFLIFFVAILAVGDARAQQSLDNLVESELPALIATYKNLHAAPELSHQEEKTSAFIARELQSLGYQVTERVGKYERQELVGYGIVAIMKNGAGATVMIRTDLDALPVEEKTGLAYASKVKTKNEHGDEVSVMHACGHDIHMTSFLGVARLLAKLKDEWKGTLVLLGQPAEETGNGAKALFNDGLYTRFPRPDFVLALHDKADLEAGKIAYCTGYALANVNSVDITVRGVGGHGAYPHTTKDPIVVAAQLVLALQTIVSRENSPLDPAVVTVGSIHGGTKYNIIPDEVKLQLTVRTYKPEVRRHVLEAIERIAKGVALTAGIPAERAPIVKVVEEESITATYNDPQLTERLVKVWEKNLGPDNVVKADPVMGGEDFGSYSLADHQVPICMFWLGAIEPARVEQSRKDGTILPSLHSSLFAPLPEPTIRTGVKAMTLAVLELMKK